MGLGGVNVPYRRRRLGRSKKEREKWQKNVFGRKMGPD